MKFLFFSRAAKHILWVSGSFSILFGIAIFSFLEKNILTVDMFDVGQGDAILIRTPYNQSILIDGGIDKRIEEKLGRALPFYDRAIDLVIVTHPQADHINGLPGVLRRYHVAKVLAPSSENDASGYHEFLNVLSQKAIPLEYAQRGKRFRFGDDLILDILSPQAPSKDYDDLNDSSVVARLRYKERSFLFTGDAGTSVEERLLAQNADVDADVLKVGHHGSESATSEAFLKRVSPQIALISAGKGNTYGHPHRALLHRLARQDIRVYRTDQGGDIRVRSDGVSVRVEREKNKY